MAWAEENKNYFLVGREMKIGANPLKSLAYTREKVNHHGFLQRINFFFRKEKDKQSQELEFYKMLAKRDAENPRIHLKLAEIYQKRQERKKATLEYLTAAEIFLKNDLLAQAMALYKKVLKENPNLEEINWKIAEVYRQMGFLGDAFRQYNHLLNQYELMGTKEKVQEIMELLVNIDPQKFMLHAAQGKSSGSTAGVREGRRLENQTSLEGMAESFFDLSEALQENELVEFKNAPEVEMGGDSGFKQIVEELRKNEAEKKVYPNFYYHLGVACWEMGFIDEAIENLKEAINNGENVFAATKLMSKCFKEKGWWEEARESLNKALQTEEIPEEEKEELKKELELIKSELMREKQILGMLNTNFSNEREDIKRKRSFGYMGVGLRIREGVTA